MGMDDDDALLASASGIIQCLRLLADEAAFLRLHGAVSAITAAMQAVASESQAEAFASCAEAHQSAAPVILH
jgi:hypothetical protein